MSFWTVVLLALIGAPLALYPVALGTIFAAAGYGNGGSKASARAALAIGLGIAWVLVGVFGAFGLAPAWRAWHGGAETFAGGPGLFVDWLAGTGLAGGLVAVAYRTIGTMDPERARRSPLLRALRWLLLALILVPYAALAAWVLWPLVLWPVHGHFAWPDAATGWMHTATVTAVLAAAAGVEALVRWLRKR